MSADCVWAPAGVTFILKPFQGPRGRYAYQSWCCLSLSFPCVPGIPGIRVVHAGASSSRGQSTVDVVTRRPGPLLLVPAITAGPEPRGYEGHLCTCRSALSVPGWQPRPTASVARSLLERLAWKGRPSRTSGAWTGHSGSLKLLCLMRGETDQLRTTVQPRRACFLSKA